MGKYHIKITELYDAPVEPVFSLLTDHETFGKVISAKIKRVKDSPGENKNGSGSVRRIKAFPLPDFEETVVTFVPNQLMEYEISKGSPIKNHKGRMEFFDEHGKTRLNYTIDFEPRLPFFLLGSTLKSVIEKPIREGLKQFASQFKNGRSA